MEDVILKTFSPADGPSALIVWVGQRHECVLSAVVVLRPHKCLIASVFLCARWKTPSNPFRAEPWSVGSIPTIIRVKDVSVSTQLVALVC